MYIVYALCIRSERVKRWLNGTKGKHAQTSVYFSIPGDPVRINQSSLMKTNMSCRILFANMIYTYLISISSNLHYFI